MFDHRWSKFRPLMVENFTGVSRNLDQPQKNLTIIGPNLDQRWSKFFAVGLNFDQHQGANFFGWHEI